MPESGRGLEMDTIEPGFYDLTYRPARNNAARLDPFALRLIISVRETSHIFARALDVERQRGGQFAALEGHCAFCHMERGSRRSHRATKIRTTHDPNLHLSDSSVGTGLKLSLDLDLGLNSWDSDPGLGVGLDLGANLGLARVTIRR